MPVSKAKQEARMSKEIVDRRNKLIAVVKKTRINNNPPIVNVRDYLHLYNIRIDTDTYIQLVKSNISLLVKMNGIMRTLGELDTFPPNKWTSLQCRHRQEIANAKRLHRENLKLGAKFLGAKRLVETGAKNICERIAEIARKEPPPFELPHDILKKYSKLHVPDDLRWQRKYFRPLISLGLELKGVRTMGRIILELYTEACPLVVLELVKLAVHQEPERMHIKRVFTKLWVDCEVVIKDKDSPLHRPLEYDMRALDHSVGMGVLSIPQNCLGGFRNGNIEFNISLVPLGVLNGKSVAFGRVKRGFRLAEALQQYGSKNGKMIKDVLCSSCALRN